jgi:multidrug efflux pump subunit AcrB
VKGAIAWFARNTVAANLLMVVIMAGGLISAFTVKREIFPEFDLDIITVAVPYLGAAPEEVEEGVNVRVEESIQGLDGIKRVTSTAAEGMGTVVVELELGADARKVLDDIKSRIDAIDTFPEQTEKPIIQELTNRRQVINLAVWGDADETTLKRLAERVRDEIASTPGISQVELANAPPYEISIEVSENTLRRHGLSFDFVARAVRRSSLDMPGGSVKTEGGEILLRTKGQAYRGREFEDLVLLTRPDGTHLRLGDVATVVDEFADTDQFSRFDGKPAILLQVFRTGDQGALEVGDKVKAYALEAQSWLPEGVQINAWRDQTKVLRDRLDLLTRNGLNGFLLVVGVLALFLRFRLAAWVSLGIPISFLGALWLMPTLDVSVNLFSLFAFIVVLGIVVDDAIIVGENIYTHHQRHGEPLKAAIEGAREVSVPVVFAVLTTVAAFMPMLAVPGGIGKIMRVMPMIVIPALLFSLVESLWILPAHLSHLRSRDTSEVANGGSRRWGWYRVQSRVVAGLHYVIERRYKPTLELALRWRYVTLAVGVATLIFTVGLVGAGWVRFIFFPQVEADFVIAALTMPQGTPVEVSSEAVAHLERTAEEVREEMQVAGEPGLYKHAISTIGDQPQSAQLGGPVSGGDVNLSGSHLGEVFVELAPAEDRTVGSEDIANRWRQRAGSIPDAVQLRVSSSLFSPGEDVDVQLTGADVAELRAAAAELKRRLAEYPGVYDIGDSFREGKREVKLQIKPAAELLGLTLGDLGGQVRQAFYGEEAQRIQRGRDDIRVMVRYPKEERRSLADMENMRIRTPDGSEVPFSQVAEVEPGRGYASITRVDRRRAVNVTASVDASLATPGDIVADLDARVMPEIRAEHPGILYTFEGSQAEQRDTLGGLQRGFTLALLMIYALLAIPLRSYLQPLVIMSAIPFGLVGAVWGHVIMGLDLTILSMFGAVALSGVVVNDSLVMVDFINRHRRTHALAEAVREAGVARFRPILLTSLTTFFGLLPLLLERSLQAKFLVPMAVSLGFGVVFATAISLILVPSGYVIAEDLKSGVQRLLGASEEPTGQAAGETTP